MYEDDYNGEDVGGYYANKDFYEKEKNTMRHENSELEQLKKRVNNQRKEIASLTAQLAEKDKKIARVTAERDAATEDIVAAHDCGLCEACGRLPYCNMNLNSGEDETVCDGKKFEWRGIKEE